MGTQLFPILARADTLSCVAVTSITPIFFFTNGVPVFTLKIRSPLKNKLFLFLNITAVFSYCKHLKQLRQLSVRWIFLISCVYEFIYHAVVLKAFFIHVPLISLQIQRDFENLKQVLISLSFKNLHCAQTVQKM